MPRLAASTHGDAHLHILRVVRRGDRDDPRDLTVAVGFEGAFAPAFVEGHTDGILPPETVKRFVRDAVRAQGDAEIEALGLTIAGRVLEAHPHVTRAWAQLAERPWTRLAPGGKAQGQSFTRAGAEQRTAIVSRDAAGSAVASGIEQLIVMQTSGFLPRGGRERADDGTQDAVEPLLVGALAARWSYGTVDVPFGPYREGVRAALVETFALHAARSVQYTLHAIAEVVLATVPEILDVTVTMEERRYHPADPLGLQPRGRDDLFVPSDGATRTVEVRLERGPAVPPREA